MDSLLRDPCQALSLGVEISKLDLSMSSISLGPNGLDSTSDQDIKVFNKLMETKDLMENPSQEGVLSVEQTTKSNAYTRNKTMVGNTRMTFKNGAQRLNPLWAMLIWGY